MSLMIGRGMRPSLMGTSIGLVAALAPARILRSIRFEIESTDPITFTAIPLLLATVALTACLIPARRATRIDPMETLRNE